MLLINRLRLGQAAVIRRPALWSLDGLDAILTQANRAAARLGAYLNGRRPACIALSGGLDSSLSLAMICRHEPDLPLMAATIGGSSDHEDIRAAREVTKTLGVMHLIIVPTPRQVRTAKRQIEATGRLPSNGDAGVFLLLDYVARLGFQSIITHDGIDELMGGYWEHRQPRTGRDRHQAFERLWSELEPNHLRPLDSSSDLAGVSVLLPYLQPEVIDYVSRLPLADRTSRETSKLPLRELANRYGLPELVIRRRKRGFCDALDQA